eukprot:TRINITY_DN45579_c0_g1_i1.p1 TRINITY_DN45579_c0_g1~~TRINITY_DN45579_c0_g1_i1.p1  ORF type:complete len:408 (-),score=72.69 TRINITY_DN45579_c0_g1_i1:857-2080(-)
MSEPPGPSVPDAASKAAVSSAHFKQLVHDHFHRLVQSGLGPNDEAAGALSAAKSEVAGEADMIPRLAVETGAHIAPPSNSNPPAWHASSAGSTKYGPLCLGLAGPFESICVTGELRVGKKLLVLDIDHTIYDPSEYGGTKGSVVKSDHSGFYDESTVARCRPGLHTFLIEAYKEYDIMVWSASDMLRILMLLQQLGILGAGHSDYKILAVLDIESMSELTSREAPETGAMEEGALMQAVIVPEGAVAGQQIETRSIADGSPMIVAVPQGLQPGDTFHVTMPGAVSSMCKELDIDAADIQLALQMSMAGVSGEMAPVAKARKRSRSIKPLSLIWACREFSHFSEKNTVIVDDTIDVCSANPHNSIQCTRYYWKDHETDTELSRLSAYLTHIARAACFPESHKAWRGAL